MRLMVDFVFCVQRLSRGLLPAFQAGSHLENQGDFITRTNRNNRVVLFSTFDVVIRECFSRRADTATEPGLTDFTGTHTGSGPNAHGCGGGFLNTLPDTIKKARAPAYSRI